MLREEKKIIGGDIKIIITLYAYKILFYKSVKIKNVGSMQCILISFC